MIQRLQLFSLRQQPVFAQVQQVSEPYNDDGSSSMNQDSQTSSPMKWRFSYHIKNEHKDVKPKPNQLGIYKNNYRLDSNPCP